MYRRTGVLHRLCNGLEDSVTLQAKLSRTQCFNGPKVFRKCDKQGSLSVPTGGRFVVVAG
jgi:hypothetical protein